MNERSGTGWLVSAALLTAAAVLAGGCAEKSGSTRSGEYGKAWYGGYYPSAAEQTPAPKAAPAQAATGSCASYRPAVGPGMGVATLAFPTGDTRSSAVLLHQVMPQKVRAGQTYDLEIHVTNITPTTLQNVAVHGESMDNMTLVSSTPSAGKGSHEAVLWVLGDLKPCQTVVIKATARTEKVGSASNCLSVSYNNVLCSALQVVQPALTLAKSVPAEALLCDPITATYEVKNTGSGTAENVVIRDSLPAGLTTADGKQTVEIAVGALAEGQSAVKTAGLKASKKGRFESAASASASGDLSAKSQPAAVAVKQPELAVSVKCPERVFLGRDMKYEITVANKGDATSANTTLTASLPAGAAFKSASDGGAPSAGGVSWTLGALPAGATKTVSLMLGGTTAGGFNVSVSARGVCADAVNASCATQLAGIPAILVECIDLDDPIEVGRNQTYLVTVLNQGSAPGTGVRVVCELPPEQAYVSSSGPTPGAAQGQTVTFAPLPTLAPKAKAEWRVVAKCNKPGDVRFRIKVTSDQFSTPIEETESTNIYE